MGANVRGVATPRSIAVDDFQALMLSVECLATGIGDAAFCNFPRFASVRDMVEPGHLDQLLHPGFENPDAYKADVIATGLPASPGAADCMNRRRKPAATSR